MLMPSLGLWSGNFWLCEGPDGRDGDEVRGVNWRLRTYRCKNLALKF